MAGAFIEVSVDTREIEDALRNLQRAVVDLQPAFRDIGEYLLRSHDERFRAGVDPDGNLWDELNPKYKARKPKNQDKVLVLNEYLMGMVYQEMPTELLFSTGIDSAKYAATHQFGRDEDGIPKRPFLGLSDADRDEILQCIENHLTGAIE